MPHWPALPLLGPAFRSSQSRVSLVSVLSSTAAPLTLRWGRMFTKSPSDIIRPRTSW